MGVSSTVPHTIEPTVIETEMLESPWEELLHYGLLLGAGIQLIAILAIIVLPSTTTYADDSDEAVAKGVDRNGTVGTASARDEGQKIGASNVKKGKLKKRKRQ